MNPASSPGARSTATQSRARTLDRRSADHAACSSQLARWLSWPRLVRRGGSSADGRAGSRRSGPATSANHADATPRGRLVALSYSIRDALIGQFGTAWRAKTTEELSAELSARRGARTRPAPGTDPIP